MTFKEIEKLLDKYTFHGFTGGRTSKHTLRYTYHSISYFTVNIIVDVIKLDKERIVAKVRIANIDIDDENELIPTLNGLYKIHNKILYGKEGNNHAKPKAI